MAVAQSTTESLRETVAEHRPEEDTDALVRELVYFWGRHRTLVGLLHGCETAVYYDRITCELKFVPVTANTVESASNQESQWIGQPRAVAEYVADPDADPWDWRNPDV